MSDEEKRQLLRIVCYQNGTLRFYRNGRPIPRIGPSKKKVRLLDKTYYASELVALCIADNKGLVDGRATASSQMATANPDMVISRYLARSLGFTLFRTGEACRRGHTGWRSVSNGACIECRRPSDTHSKDAP